MIPANALMTMNDVVASKQIRRYSQIWDSWSNIAIHIEVEGTNAVISRFGELDEEIPCSIIDAEITVLREINAVHPADPRW